MPQKRKPHDIIPPENMPRSAIDRPIQDIDGLFAKAFGWRDAPVQTAARMALEQGGVALGDIGCGSGNTLRTWSREVRHAACRANGVSTTGVNKFDYSDQSGYPATVKACADGTIRYIVADVVEGIPIEDGSLDVVLAYRSIEHCADPSGWMCEMLRVTRPGGSVFFTADTHTQFGRGNPLPDLLQSTSFAEEPALEHACIETQLGNVFYLTLGRLALPAA